MSDQDRAAKLLRAARLLLAWDAMKTQVPELSTLRSLVGLGQQMSGLLKMLADHYYKDTFQHLETAAKVLQANYLGTGGLKHGLPPEKVKHIDTEVAAYVTKLRSAANREAHRYDGNDMLGAAFTILPVSAMAAVLVKSSGRYWTAGHTALEGMKKTGKKPVVPGAPKGASVVVAAHDAATMKTLFTQVLPWLAKMKATADGAAAEPFPAQKLQKLGTDGGQKFVKEFQTHFIDDDLVAQYRTDHVDSLRALLTFCAFGVAIRDLELREMKLEQQAKTYVQSAVSKMRGFAQEQRKETNESTPLTTEAPADNSADQETEE